MALIEDLIAAAGDADTPVSGIVTGQDWMMVTAAGSGVAAMPPVSPANYADGTGAGVLTTDFAEEYLHRPLRDLLDLASSPDRIKASLGVAALNSVLAGGRSMDRPRSLSIPRAGGKTVAVIGEFAFIEDLKRVAARVITAGAGTDDPGEESGPDTIFAGVDIAIIRGSTLMDGTLESWLARARHCYTVVYGPSTPLSPLLFEYGADRLVGIRVDIDDVAADWIRNGREDLLACPGIRPVVLSRDQASGDQQSR